MKSETEEVQEVPMLVEFFLVELQRLQALLLEAEAFLELEAV